MNDRKQPTPNQGKSLLQWLRPTRRRLKWLILLILFSFIAGWCFVQFYVFLYFKPHLILSTGRNDYKQMKAFWNQTLDFPEEYITGVPISKELKQAYENINKNRAYATTHHERTLDSERNNDAVGQIVDWWYSRYRSQSASSLNVERLQQVEPYIKALFEASDQIEDDIASLSPCDLLPIYPRASIDAAVLLVKAEWLSQHEKYNEAFDTYTAAYPLLLHCPFQNFWEYRLNSQLTQTMRYAETIVKHVSSLESLRKGLQRLNRLEPFFFRNLRDRYTEFYIIALIRGNEQRYRERFDAAPGKKIEEYIHQIAALRIPQMKLSHCASCIWQWLIAGRKPTDEEIAGMLRPFSLSNAPNEYFYLQTYKINKSTILYNEEEAAWNEYDFLRLKIAARLYKLETGKNVAATTDLIPKYLSKEIIDRQPGASYMWSENGDLLGIKR